MATLSDLNTKRAELNTAIDDYKQAVIDFGAGSIDQSALDAAKAAAQAKGDEYAKLTGQVKKDDPSVTSDDDLFSNPAVQTALIRDDVAGIMTTGQLLSAAMKLLVDTEGNASNATNVVISFASGSDVTVDWGDGTVQAYTGAAGHDYATPGQYEVLVTGTINGFTSALAANNRQIKDLARWGAVELVSTDYMFRGRRDFTISATDSPNFLPGASCVRMFWDAADFNSPIGHWDMSNVVDTNRMLIGASSFNQPLNDWNVSNVTNMALMFQEADAFNQPLNNWNVGSVTDMQQMFYGTAVFNQDLTMWDVDQVTNSTSFSGSSALSTGNRPNF